MGILSVGILLGALIIALSKPGPQLWAVAFLAVVIFYGLAFSMTYNMPWVEKHHNNGRSRVEKKGESQRERVIGPGSSY